MSVFPMQSTTGNPIFRSQTSSLQAIRRFTRGAADASQKLNSQERIVSPGEDALAFSTSRYTRAQVASLKVVSETGQLNVAGLSLAIDGLDGVKVQLDKIKKALLQGQVADASDREMIQGQIDLALSQIDSTAKSTKFGNRSLLNGDSSIKGYEGISNVGLINDYAIMDGESLSQTSGIKAVRVNRLGSGGPIVKLNDGRTILSLRVSVHSTQKATKAMLQFTPGDATGDFAEWRVTGKLGSAMIRIDSNANSLGKMSAVALAFNSRAGETGVVLTSDGGNSLVLSSVGFGGDEFVKVELVSAGESAAGDSELAFGNVTNDPALVGEAQVAYGNAAQVRINGTRIAMGGEFGTTARYTQNGFDLEIDFNTNGLVENANTINSTVVIDMSKGMSGMFGPSGASGDVVQYGFGDFRTEVLGRGNGQWSMTEASSGQVGSNANVSATATTFGNQALGNNSIAELAGQGRLSIRSGQLRESLATIDRAISQGVREQTRLGTLQGNFIDSVNRAEASVGNLSAADSDILGVDAAAEIANLIQAQLGVSTASSVMAQTNAIHASIFAILRG